MRILGLHIGTDRITATEVESAFGRFEIRDTFETAIPQIQENSYSMRFSLAQQCIEGRGKKYDKIVISAPSEMTTLRNLTLSTSDRKALLAAIQFELEDDLPFDADHYHYDSVILKGDKNQRFVHVGIVEKNQFDAWITQLQSSPFVPQVITTQAWAMRSLTLPMQSVTSSDLIFQLGEERSQIYWIHQGLPALCRDLPFGVKDLKNALIEQIPNAQDQVQNWIQDVGFTGIDEQVTETLKDAFDSCFFELKQAELSARALGKISIEQIYITGEGALIPGLISWINEGTQKNIQLFRPFSKISGSVQYADLTESRFALSLGLALSQVPKDKTPALNLKKGAYNDGQDSSQDFWKIPETIAPYALVALVLFSGSQWIEKSYYDSQLEDLEMAVKKSAKNFFPGTTEKQAGQMLEDLDSLQAKVAQEVQKERDLSKLFSVNVRSPLQFLKILSEKIPKDTVLDLVQTEINPDSAQMAFDKVKELKATLSFVVANPQNVAKLKDILLQNFQMKPGVSEEITFEGRKMTRISFQGVMKENPKP